jgi:hypothetical protein
VADRHFRKLEAERRRREAEGPVGEPDPVSRPAAALEKQREEKPRGVRPPNKAGKLEPETDLPSFPPYSVGAFVGRDGKDRGRDNLSGPAAIRYAELALGDPKTIGVEIYDRNNSLVAAGSRGNGLRLIRRLADAEPDPVQKTEPVAGAGYFEIPDEEGPFKCQAIGLVIYGEERREITVDGIVAEEKKVRKLLEAALLAKIALFDEGEKMGRLWMPINPNDKDDPANLVAHAPREKLREALAAFGL